MRRWIRYRLVVPLFRSPHSAAYTARGVANGVFWGLTPTIGLQTAEIIATWFLARRLLGRDSSLVQALVWVWINNPLTVLPMYYGFYLTGVWLSGESAPAPGYETFAELFERQSTTWSASVMTIAERVGRPLLIGCVPFAVLGSIVSYRWAVTLLRRRHERLGRNPLDSETFRTSNSSR